MVGTVGRQGGHRWQGNHNDGGHGWQGNGDAAIAQVVMLPMTIAIALVTGLVAGTIAKKVTVLAPDLLFKDDSFFDVPSDFTSKVRRSVSLSL